MDRILQAACLPEQSLILTLNAWRYAYVSGKHIRLRPCTSDVAVAPHGPVNYRASIELVAAADATWGVADDAATAIFSLLFGSQL